MCVFAARYDLILGADLLFFESHAALAAALDRLLARRRKPVVAGGSGAPGSGGGDGGDGGGGTVLLCQPSRSGTMEAFAAHPAVTRRFFVERFETGALDPAVAAMHDAYRADPSYDPNIHAPCLLRLTRK